MLNFDDKIICQYLPAVNCAVIYNQIITHFQKGLGNNKYIKTTQPGQVYEIDSAAKLKFDCFDH